MTPESERRLTVLNRNRERALVPELRLVDKWLARAGFAPGSRVAVTVEPGLDLPFTPHGCSIKDDLPPVQRVPAASA